ncbi:MAG: dienelactone hydrolase family protein [Rhabdochlamydiaceae bacterium]|nr:dienelactone hydrolase family protein [Candidatus Amphrikana amoebophyrae]
MKEEFVEYNDGAFSLEAFVARESDEKKPTVIIFHAFRGRDEFVCNMARRLAKMGYIAFAADIYGKGVLATSKEESMSLMMPYLENRDILRKRVKLAFDAACTLDYVDSSKVATIGYCFGGLCALDLARSGVDIKAAVSFHGLLSGVSKELGNEKIKAKILACHGGLDPQVPSSQVQEFKQEMKEASVDWQLHIYGQAMHAFTNPAANDIDFGTVYNCDADKRSFKSMIDLFNEVF